VQEIFWILKIAWGFSGICWGIFQGFLVVGRLSENFEEFYTDSTEHLLGIFSGILEICFQAYETF
jgi:hypothetical protein